MSQKILFINFERHLHGFFTGIENVYFKSPSDLKTALYNRSEIYGPPCSYIHIHIVHIS